MTVTFGLCCIWGFAVLASHTALQSEWEKKMETPPMTRQGVALVIAVPSNDRELGLSVVVCDYVLYIYVRLLCAALSMVRKRWIALCSAQHSAQEVYGFVQHSAQCTRGGLLCAALSTVPKRCMALCRMALGAVQEGSLLVVASVNVLMVQILVSGGGK